MSKHLGFIAARERWRVGGNNWNYITDSFPSSHSQITIISTPTQFFYSQDALPAAKPTVSSH